MEFIKKCLTAKFLQNYHQQELIEHHKNQRLMFCNWIMENTIDPHIAAKYVDMEFQKYISEWRLRETRS